MGDWDSRLVFDLCADVKVCVVSYFCGPCNLAYQKAAVDEKECGVGTCILTTCFFPCCACMVRSSIRQKYNIDGSALGDFCASYCCGICALAQQTRELDSKGAKPAGMCMES